MTQKSPETLQGTPDQLSLVEISLITPRKQDWLAIEHGSAAAEVAQMALDVCIATGFPVDPDRPSTLSDTYSAVIKEADGLQLMLMRDHANQEQTIIPDEKRQSVVAGSVQLLADQSPSDLRGMLERSEFKAYVAAIKRRRETNVEIVDVPSDMGAFISKYYPEFPVQQPAPEEVPGEVINPPERDTSWRLHLGPLTVSFALQRNSV